MKEIEIFARGGSGQKVRIIEPGKKGYAYISINGQTIRKNSRTGTKEPPIRIAKSQRDKSPRYAHEIAIAGSSHLLYSPDEPIMGCGARLVLLALNGDVKVIR